MKCELRFFYKFYQKYFLFQEEFMHMLNKCTSTYVFMYRTRYSCRVLNEALSWRIF
jgi:hypothetical protein